MALSKIQIIGNLGRDPELRYTPNGRPVASFTVAVNQSTKNQQTGEWIEATDWFRVTVFGNQAERMAENLRKGNRVFVDGRFKSREWEGQDGAKKSRTEIICENMIMLDRGTGAPATASAGAPAKVASAAEAPINDNEIRVEDIPF